MRLSILFSVLALVSFASTIHFWVRARRLRREADGLKDEAADWKSKAAEWATLAELNQDTNYRLACQLHGKDAVDRATREAHAKGTN